MSMLSSPTCPVADIVPIEIAVKAVWVTLTEPEVNRVPSVDDTTETVIDGVPDWPGSLRATMTTGCVPDSHPVDESARM
jgi:hypothetical protein